MAGQTMTMSMNEVIHCAVRRDLRRFRTALEQFPAGDQARAAGLHTAWANFDRQLTEHHEGEHEVAWPALTAIGVPETSIATFDQEHETMAAALRAAGQAMDRLARTATAADAQAASAAMAALEQATTSHLDHEEREVEPLLLTRTDHPAYKQMSKQFSRRSSLPVAGTFFAWMEDRATTEERAALRQSVPGPVVAVIGGLFGRRYRKEVAPVWASTGSF
jgi:hemerythrin-like domain-containing protein